MCVHSLRNRVALPLPGYKDTRVINIEEHRRVVSRVDMLQRKLKSELRPSLVFHHFLFVCSHFFCGACARTQRRDENKNLQQVIENLKEKEIRNFDAQYDRLCAEIEDRKQKNHLLEEQLRKM